jgi:hypothetical protein
MDRHVYRYTFSDEVPFDDVLATINLAIIGVQSLHGEERTRLDARFTSDSKTRALVIDAATSVGQELNQLLVGYARREFGDKAFRVDRVEHNSDSSASNVSSFGAAA